MGWKGWDTRGWGGRAGTHAALLAIIQVHIWVEPPKPHQEYIFFGRPARDKRVMDRDKLRSWCVHAQMRACVHVACDKLCSWQG